nr:immunoglobulin heavy chain junction region [Macaca mulatta]MOX59772.1 immunoglobulin heavy chain junction region [Macaca mulatta]MOX59923.1 immunoglobulin heavy chain junction region [Macaca mulatta]MOX62618.1 immunoglobulin heavy chain junction region [Macaca mulatta]MOX63325.1 immunoglobulin heavy chain junction region [Macaca mulatta]
CTRICCPRDFSSDCHWFDVW